MHDHRPIPGADGRILPPPLPPRAAFKCPRCDSLDTKFCYFNNYNLSQPRHFCRSCRRYWTRGGALRNVPVGGACRKPSKRPPSSSSSTTSPPRPRKRPAPPHPPSPRAGTITGCTEPQCQGPPLPPPAAVEELRLPPELAGFGFSDPAAEWAGAVCFWPDGDPSALFSLP